MTGRKTFVVAFVAASLGLSTAALATTDPTIPTIAAPQVGVPAGLAPKAYIVVDQATGRVVAASNERQALPPASLSKILTALTAVSALKPTDTVPVSARAAGMPAHKLSMKVGEMWPLNDTLNALLVSSANDAAAALAERISGTMENFRTALGQEAATLQLSDHPVLQDPSGLDDSWSIGGGNQISARDLAIASRALLANPTLASIVKEPVVRFTDPSGVPHRLINHNKLLTRFFGTVGLKTGFTKKSGRGLVAAATRNGRTFVAVIMNVSDTYGWAEGLLGQAFAMPVPTTGDQLPAIATGVRIKTTAAPLTTPATVAATATTTPAVIDNPSDVIVVKPVAASRGGLPLFLVLPLGALITLLVMISALRARVLMKRNRRKRRRTDASIKHHPNRRRDPVLTPHYVPHEEMSDRFHTATRD